MKITVNTKDILKLLQAVGGVIKSPNQMPILDNVLFNLTNAKLQIVADNLEVRSSAEMAIDYHGEFTYSTCIPYQMLVATLKGFPNTPVEFVFGEKQLTVQAVTGNVINGKYDIPMFQADEYPKNKFQQEGEKTSVNALELVEAIRKTAAYIDEKSMNGLSNLMVWVGPEGTKVVGGSSMFIYEYSIDEAKGPEKKLYLSKSVAAYLVQSITEDDTLDISYNDNHVFFTLEGREISAVLGNLQYPAYEKLFASLVTDKVFHIEKDSFMPAFKRLCNITDKNSVSIDFAFAGDTLEMNFKHIMEKCSAKEVVKVDYDGEPLLIALNSSQLHSALQSLEGDIKLNMLAVNKACMLTAENTRILTMPMLPAGEAKSSPKTEAATA